MVFCILIFIYIRSSLFNLALITSSLLLNFFDNLLNIFFIKLFFTSFCILVLINGTNFIEKEIKQKLKEDQTYAEAVRNMLQDTGIKTKIIKQYLPIMNKLINTYLTSMEFYVNFTLDENFNETIKSRYRDEFTYESFSEGEKMRIDLALLFTWRAVAKMKNSTNTNLLMLDEIFDSSLDGAGTDEFLKILHTLSDENIFVISHKQDVLVDKFRSTIKFEKVRNFSHVVE